MQKKIGEIWLCGFRVMRADKIYKLKQINKHTHDNTLHPSLSHLVTTIYKQISNKRTHSSNSCLTPELYNLRQSLKQCVSYRVFH